MLEKAQKILHQFDMFSCAPILRAKAEPDVVNSCGGLVSLGFLIFFVSLKLQIGKRYNRYRHKETVQKVVRIGVEGMDIQFTKPYVRFEFVQYTMNGTAIIGARNLQSQPCQKSHWQSYVSDIDKAFSSYNMKNKMCLKPGQTLSIMQTVSGVYKFVTAVVNKCRRLYQNGSMIYSGCETQENTTMGNMYWIQTYKYFTVVILYVNTAFNPIQKTATTKYIDPVRLTFTITRGTQAIVQLSTYQITTDQSILPFEDNVVQEGYTFDLISQQNFEAVDYFEQVNCMFVLSSKTILITRTIGKIDAILSYAGGLFGIIISFLAFFMMSFNQYRYQLLVAQGAFNYSEDGKKIKQTDFNFIMYLKYSFYDWVSTLLCFQPKWNQCRQIDQTRQQANNQLDVNLLFKKIQHFQRVNQYLLSQKQDIGLYLTEPPSLDQVKRKRQIAQYYDKIIKGKNAITVQDVKNADILFEKVLIQQNVIQPTRQELMMNTTKSKLNEQPDKSRQNILQYALQKFGSQIDSNDVQLSEEQLKVELEIAQSFFRMTQQARRRIQQKVPLKILRRLTNIYENSLSKQTMQINLQI